LEPLKLSFNEVYRLRKRLKDNTALTSVDHLLRLVVIGH